ncbi:MAG: ArsR family transcriptional [Geobacteraceae bacterium]|nr:MAG: ArsR family transcriptional [Geobacteraceae bacterium]
MAREGICEIECIDETKVATVRGKLLAEDATARLAGVFKVLGDGTRVRIIHALSLAELCVCDIASLLGTTKSAVSHQLRMLRNMRVVRYRKAGKIVYYSLDDTHIGNLFGEGLKHISMKEGNNGTRD